MAVVRDLLKLIEIPAPSGLAAEWDNVGLMVGDPGADVNRVALALDPCPATIGAAADMGAQVLLTHHPLVFRPLKNLNLSDPTAAACALALQNKVAVVSAHTNLDAANNGVSRALADCLELRDIRILDPITGESHYQLTAHLPLGYEDALRRAWHSAGVCCGDSFSSRVHRAHFNENDDRLDREDQVRIEAVIQKSDLKAAIDAIGSMNTPGSPSYDIRPQVSVESDVGYGCIGYLEKEMEFEHLVKRVLEKLEAAFVRIASPAAHPVSRIAVMGGSGGSALRKAQRQGADVFITGDLGYHHAREAEDLGIGLIDAGHFATEWPIIPKLTSMLKSLAAKSGFDLDIQMIKNEKDPWKIMEV